MIGAFCLRLNDKVLAKLYPSGKFDSINWSEKVIKPDHPEYEFYEFKTKDESPSLEIIIENPIDQSFCIRLRETVRYCCRVLGENIETEVLKKHLPSFSNEGNRLLKIDRDMDSLTFQFVNYLGYCNLSFTEDNKNLLIEIVPNKIDYEDDYVRLTEALAEECSALLLDYSGVTFTKFSQTEDNANLLEQFIFLRKFCYSDNILSLFESIKRNPDRILEQEDLLKPFGSSIPSQKFFSKPFFHSREWQQTGNIYLPQEISVTRKYDSLNTPANRFIKYALKYFQEICEKLIQYLDKKEEDSEHKKQVECLLEAKRIYSLLDDILLDSFFDDVFDLDIMPQNNQVLQKREGYSQIFNAFSMVDLALQLDWKGKDEVYNGESKNTALLYEYWLFFVLYSIVKNIAESDDLPQSDGIEKITKDVICVSKDGGLLVSLREGESSKQHFYIKDTDTNVNLYYNKTFGPTDFKGTAYWGSYSRPFRPDYTIALYKGKGRKEKEAIEAGDVSYVHFDAKYRITDLSAFISNPEKKKLADNTGDSYESTLTEDESKELEIEKAESVTNTYQRGDLLKMHTYNDAIRRTMGSYVLYPGDDRKGEAKYSLYEEILPGVGAFAVKPSTIKESKSEIKSFIEGLIEYKSRKETRLARKTVLENTIILEPSVEKSDKDKEVINQQLHKEKELCLIGYLRPEYRNAILSNLVPGGKFLYYYYAINQGYVYVHHKDTMKAQQFRFYSNVITDQTSDKVTYKLSKYKCKINSTELVSKAQLSERLGDNSVHGADFYFLSEIEVLAESPEIDLTIEDINQYEGNDVLTPHSPKVIRI